VALRAGRLDLAIQAPGELLSLPDPYDPARKSSTEVKQFVKDNWDLSFYGGKFYTYWGPAPAVILSVVKLIYDVDIADQYLAFALLAGLLFFTVLLMLKMRRAFAADTPPALLLIGVIVAGLAVPMPWMMNRARVYEAAVAAGQFFLIGGLFFAYTALDRPRPSLPWLLAASVFWSCAIGSRLITVVPVAFLLVITLAWTLRRSSPRPDLRTGVGYAIALAAPVAAGVLALAWYNLARFGSPFETGLRYQLTDQNLNRFYSDVFSLSYLPGNLLLYLVNAVSLRLRFPFVDTTVMSLPTWLAPSVASIYHVQNSIGILVAMPLAVFAAVPIVRLSMGAPKLWRRDRARVQDADIRAWLLLSLVGILALSFGTLLLYFYVAVRYLAELTPVLALLSLLGIWEAYYYTERRPVLRAALLASVVLMALVTITIGILLPLGEENGTLFRFNPQLLRQLLALFGQ
ncbi:MAG: hypothetical protein ACM3MF_10825, partial [Anaerolineae bacterium]